MISSLLLRFKLFLCFLVFLSIIIICTISDTSTAPLTQAHINPPSSIQKKSLIRNPICVESPSVCMSLRWRRWTRVDLCELRISLCDPSFFKAPGLFPYLPLGSPGQTKQGREPEGGPRANQGGLGADLMCCLTLQVRGLGLCVCVLAVFTG